jgi:hypothetical protein
MCFLWQSREVSIIHLTALTVLFLLMETQSAYCEIAAEPGHVI